MERMARGIVTGVILLTFTTVVSGCPECRIEVERGVYDEDFSSNLFIMLLPIIVLVSIGIGLYHADEITERVRSEINQWQTKRGAVR